MARIKSNLKTKRLTFIREWRKHRLLTLERLAERLNVTASSISQLERGETGYTQPLLEALAEALNCEPADLLMRDPKSEPGIFLVWSKIPESDKERAIEILKTFVPKKGTGTEG